MGLSDLRAIVEERVSLNTPLIADFHCDGTAETLWQGIRQQVQAFGLGPKWKELYTAYALATVEHECAGKWRPIEEYGEGKGDNYTLYYGRGLVQLTWKKNYQTYQDILGLSLVENPTLVLRSDVSLFILVHGMWFGKFTGRGFNGYPSPTIGDFVDMRRIINGTDKAVRIANLAKKYL
jgi:Chitinase class I